VAQTRVRRGLSFVDVIKHRSISELHCRGWHRVVVTACCALECLFPRSRSSFVVRAVLAQTSRTAVYGPVRTVVWQGAAGDRRPYADQVALRLLIITVIFVVILPCIRFLTLSALLVTHLGVGFVAVVFRALLISLTILFAAR
jgi:hypothetical protein